MLSADVGTFQRSRRPTIQILKSSLHPSWPVGMKPGFASGGAHCLVGPRERVCGSPRERQLRESGRSTALSFFLSISHSIGPRKIPRVHIAISTPTIYSVCYHIPWCPKCRHKVLVGKVVEEDVEARFKELLHKKAQGRRRYGDGWGAWSGRPAGRSFEAHGRQRASQVHSCNARQRRQA